MAISVTILINACHYCTVLVNFVQRREHSVFVDLIYSFQKIEFLKNIEKLRFWAIDDSKIQFAKGELLSQIKYLDMSITAKGFFTINRQLMASVRDQDHLNFVWKITFFFKFVSVGGCPLHLYRNILSISSGCILMFMEL